MSLKVKEGTRGEECLILQFGFWLTLQTGVLHIGYGPHAVCDPCLAVNSNHVSQLEFEVTIVGEICWPNLSLNDNKWEFSTA
jgi:hypothetical protein